MLVGLTNTDDHLPLHTSLYSFSSLHSLPTHHLHPPPSHLGLLRVPSHSLQRLNERPGLGREGIQLHHTLLYEPAVGHHPLCVRTRMLQVRSAETIAGPHPVTGGSKDIIRQGSRQKLRQDSRHGGRLMGGENERDLLRVREIR